VAAGPLPVCTRVGGSAGSQVGSGPGRCKREQPRAADAEQRAPISTSSCMLPTNLRAYVPAYLRTYVGMYGRREHGDGLPMHAT
jgi:hypothetical protein